MSRYRRALVNSIGAEARAYGFSLTALAGAYLCSMQHGPPHVAALFAYLGGALAGQIAVAALAFGGWGATWSSGERAEYRVYAAVHLVSVLAAALAAWGVSWLVRGAAAAYGATGFAAVVVYQLLLAAELALGMRR